MGEIEVTGPEAQASVNELVTNDLARVADGQAMYTCCCNESGTILDDLIVYRIAVDRILVVCNASNRDKIVPHFQQVIGSRAVVRDVSDDTALLALQGPRAFDVLRRVSDGGIGASPTDLEQALKPFRFRTAKIAGVNCTVARTGYTGEDGVELFCASDDAPALWRALLEDGKAFGIEPVGLGARDTLRLEARLSLYGNDIDETTNPLEAGLGWTVKLDTATFVGKEALLATQRAGLSRKLVGFEMRGRGVARHGYPLLDAAKERVGICTSGAPSPTLGKSIGLGYLALALTEPGSKFYVDCRGKHIEAEVVKTPFYKRARSG
jgi:aminomethyltransferase